MAAKSAIEWTDASWTPIRARNRATGKVGWHCVHKSPGCANCYSEGMNMRLGTGLPFKPGHEPDIEVFLDEKMLLAPLRWKSPRMIFVCSMTDLFADFVKDEWIDRVFAVMALARQHTFQVLTKRSARMREWVRARSRADADGFAAEDVRVAMTTLACTPSRKVCKQIPWPLPNVWLGVSAERQAEANERVPDLLATQAAVRFVSAEPLLEEIDFTRVDDGAAHREVPREEWGDVDDDDSPPALWWDALTGERTIMHGGADGDWSRTDARLDWIIVGGESGPGARPMHPDWPRSIRDQCASAGVPFFFKQWGAWAPAIGLAVTHRFRTNGEFLPEPEEGILPRGQGMRRRVGKHRAGRLLDGREHNAFPAPRS